ncbi:MAG: hypothetical protein L6Q31_02045 [Fimbriimonadaceae bacterium]|nr:hypothetical protein [Fimbriimonadaceae bacterium]NUM37590.1 hypothetical protein [Armatimonadota bacterium]
MKKLAFLSAVIMGTGLLAGCGEENPGPPPPTGKNHPGSQMQDISTPAGGGAQPGANSPSTAPTETESAPESGASGGTSESAGEGN